MWECVEISHLDSKIIIMRSSHVSRLQSWCGLIQMIGHILYSHASLFRIPLGTYKFLTLIKRKEKGCVFSFLSRRSSKNRGLMLFFSVIKASRGEVSRNSPNADSFWLITKSKTEIALINPSFLENCYCEVLTDDARPEGGYWIHTQHRYIDFPFNSRGHLFIEYGPICWRVWPS